MGHAPGGGSAQALLNCRISCLPACLACLLAGVHVPVAWSDVRPTDEEFREAFASVRLRCHRVVDFVRARRAVLRRLVLTNSEGYWAGGCSAAAAARGMAPEGVLLALLRKPVYMQCRRVCSCCFCLPDMLSAALTCHCLPACLPACPLLPAEDGEFVPLASKHNFNLGTLGMLLGMLQEGLTELQIIHCNDLFASGSPLSTIAMLR